MEVAFHGSVKSTIVFLRLLSSTLTVLTRLKPNRWPSGFEHGSGDFHAVSDSHCGDGTLTRPLATL